ncbi:MAG: helix-turn-helix transcriptional regulator, partial [Oscillospiraceae bacterium]|nr:helix-turn-helix transcriptional regulator [Oscillospiraceae bacterium]
PPMTQEDLAREINMMGMEMTPLIISRIEKNQRHVVDGELKALAQALGVTMEWLCSEDA